MAASEYGSSSGSAPAERRRAREDVLLASGGSSDALAMCRRSAGRGGAWPFFSAAGLESGAYYLGPTVAGMRPKFEALLEHLHCPAPTAGSSAAVDCLLRQDVAALAEANSSFGSHVPTAPPSEPAESPSMSDSSPPALKYSSDYYLIAT